MRNTLALSALESLIVGIALFQVPDACWAGAQESNESAPAASNRDMESLQSSAGAFEKAFNAHDAKAIAEQFSDNAEAVDDDGALTRGRDKIQHRFEELFKEFPKARIDVEVTSVRQLTPSVAVEDGFSTTKLGEKEPATRSPYSVVHAKKDGKWLIVSVRDFPAESTATPHDHLQSLQWLVGHWVDEGPLGRVETTCKWSDDKNYLLQDFVVKTRRGGELKGVQRIGWDPLRRTIRGWVFAHGGEFGETTWTPVEGGWIVNAQAVTADGKNAFATRVLTPISADSYQIDSSNQTVGNERVPDSTVRVVRRPPDPGK